VVNRKKPTSLLGKFSVLSFLVLFTLGGILDYDITRFVSRQFIHIYNESYNQSINATVSLIFEPQDFSKPLSAEHKRQLDLVLGKMVSLGQVKKFKIWSPDNVIIYSSDPSLIGKPDPHEKDVRKALNGQPVAKIIEKDGEEHGVSWFHRDDEAIELYLPVTHIPSNRIISVFEVYLDTRDFLNHIATAKRYLAGAIIGGFIILYVTLFQIVRKASQTITQQDHSLRNLAQRLKVTLHDQAEAHVGTIQALMAALDAKDRYTAGHSTRVADLSVCLGRKLDLPAERLKILEEAALFHDIGKIGISENLLGKKDRLNQEDVDNIKVHTEIGARIINTVSSFTEHARLIRHHHERYDGRGYPDGLKGEEIPLESRILSIADTYDALTSDRPYRKGIPAQEAVNVIQQAKGTQLDPHLVDIFLTCIEKKH